jgi:hypothetical protein
MGQLADRLHASFWGLGQGSAVRRLGVDHKRQIEYPSPFMGMCRTRACWSPIPPQQARLLQHLHQIIFLEVFSHKWILSPLGGTLHTDSTFLLSGAQAFGWTV